MSGPTIIDSLTPAILEVVPELEDIAVPAEPRADCSACVKVPPQIAADHPWAFHPDTRCCTYHPDLPNYLAGRALGRNYQSAVAVRRRLADPSGVTAWGVREPETWTDRQVDTKKRFGRSLELRCPYWIDGPLSCGIWTDRTGVCRSWFCKHEHGQLSRARWRVVEGILTRLERGIAIVLAADGPDRADADGWERWFRQCADRVLRLGRADLAGLRDDLLKDLLARWRSLSSEQTPALVDAPVPQVSHGFGHDGAVAIEGYSDYDGVEGPPELLDALAALDGAVTWREALAGAGLEGPAGDDLIAELHRIGALRDPVSLPPTGPLPHRVTMPDVVVPSLQRPIAVGDKVWLRGSSPAVSMVAPRAVFDLLARLDGRPWRTAVAEVDGVDDELCQRLYEIGALTAARG